MSEANGSKLQRSRQKQKEKKKLKRKLLKEQKQKDLIEELAVETPECFDSPPSVDAKISLAD